MSEFFNPLQLAVYNRLVAAMPTRRIYDSPPNQPDGMPDSSFPYVVIGDDTLAPFDTDDAVGTSATVTIHVWSRYNGRKEVKTILGQLYSALNRQAPALSAAGYYFIDSLYEFGDIIEEADGKTRHGVCRFRITMEKT
jgi:hypothetical protein